MMNGLRGDGGASKNSKRHSSTLMNYEPKPISTREW